MTMKKCTCAECDDFSENKPHIKPNKERYEEMLRAQGFGVKNREEGVAVLSGMERALASLDDPKPVADKDGWISHTPGDKMPCSPKQAVDVQLHTGKDDLSGQDASEWNWTTEGFPQIIAWRPARQEQNAEPDRVLHNVQLSPFKGIAGDSEDWRWHNAGQKMPCEAEDRVDIKFHDGSIDYCVIAKARTWDLVAAEADNSPFRSRNIIAWRPWSLKRELKREEQETEVDFEAELQIVTQQRDKLKEESNFFRTELRRLEHQYVEIGYQNDDLGSETEECKARLNEAADLVEALAFHLPVYYKTRREQVKAFIDKCRGVSNG